MVTSVFKVASRTVTFFHAPLLAPDSNFPIPENDFIHLVKTIQNNSKQNTSQSYFILFTWTDGRNVTEFWWCHFDCSIFQSGLQFWSCLNHQSCKKSKIYQFNCVEKQNRTLKRHAFHWKTDFSSILQGYIHSTLRNGNSDWHFFKPIFICVLKRTALFELNTNCRISIFLLTIY